MEESSINQESLWRKQFPEKKKRVRGRGNLARLDSCPMEWTSSAHANDHTQVLEAKVASLQEELEKTRNENAAMINKLIAALTAQGLDLSVVNPNASSNVAEDAAVASQSNVGGAARLCKRRREDGDEGGEDDGFMGEADDNEGENFPLNPDEAAE